MSVGLHLYYKFNLRAAESLADHDYCKETLFNANVLNREPQKHININKFIETKYSNSKPLLGGNLEIQKRKPTCKNCFAKQIGNYYDKVSYASRSREFSIA